jgi:hypothetical protein
MQTMEFILVFTLLLGVGAALLSTIFTHTQETHQKNEEWKMEAIHAQCEWEKKRALAYFILIPGKECMGEEWAGWDANHYE